MILEIANFHLQPGQETAFEEAFAKARVILAQAKGHLHHELLRCHETPSHYVLLVRWERLEDHTVGFRTSALFMQWRGYLQAYFETPPEVGHYIRPPYIRPPLLQQDS